MLQAIMPTVVHEIKFGDGSGLDPDATPHDQCGSGYRG